jgi:hypothetical protein
MVESIALKRSSPAYIQTSPKVIVPSIRLYEQNTQNPTLLTLPMKLTIELEEPYAKELELRAYRSGQTVKEYVEESIRADVEADLSFDEKTALHKELAERN